MFDLLYNFSYQKFESMILTIIRNSSIHINGNRRYEYLVLSRKPFFNEGTLWFEEQVNRRRYHQDARFSSRGIRGKG